MDGRVEDDDDDDDNDDDNDDDEEEDSKLSHSESFKSFGWELMNSDANDVRWGGWILEKQGHSNYLATLVSTQIIGLINLLETEIFLLTYTAGCVKSILRRRCRHYRRRLATYRVQEWHKMQGLPH